MKLGAVVGAALAVALSGTAAQAGNLVANGNFATGDLSNWTVFTTANGTVGTPSVVSFDVTGAGAQNAAEFQVGDVFWDQTPHGGGVEQGLTTGAGVLTVTGDIAAYASYGNMEAGILNVLLDGAVIGDYQFGVIGFGQTLRSSFGFTTNVTPGSHDLQIEFLRPYLTASDTPEEFLTNVSATVASVPEPATWAMLIVGVAMIGFAARRRNAGFALAA